MPHETMPAAFKERLRDQCLSLLKDKIDYHLRLMDDLKNGTANDAKSSAGDKHETAISMMQLEQEKLNRQLLEFRKQYESALRVSALESKETVNVGSLVHTNQGHFYLLSALGKIMFENHEIICLSPAAPLAKALSGKKCGDKFNFMGKGYEVIQAT